MTTEVSYLLRSAGLASFVKMWTFALVALLGEHLERLPRGEELVSRPGDFYLPAFQ